MAIAAEKAGRETLATTFILDGDIHLNESRRRVTCPWHGLEFHVPTGRCMAWPEIRLRTYDVTVVDGEIEVAL